MSPQRPGPVVLLAGALLSAGLVVAATTTPSNTTAAAGAARPDPASHRESLPGVHPLYTEAAKQARRGDFHDAERLLAPLLAAGTAETGRAGIVLGLLAWDGGQCAMAREWLGRGPGPSDLEDWRLFGLAACAREHADAASQAEARAALESLVALAPPSPLAARAVVQLAEIAWSARDAVRAIAWIERGRSRALAPAERAALDGLAWTIGRATGDRAIEIEATRRLLIAAPLEAARLEVAAALSSRGEDWRNLLFPSELLERSASLLAVDVPQGALTTLEAVPLEARDLEWTLLSARALIANEQGAAALAQLSAATGATADERAAIELARAHAAAEAATVRRGKPHPPAEERQRLKALGRAALVRAGDLAESAELKSRALSELFAELEGEDRIEEAIAVLRRLAPISPGTRLGGRALWERGWREYRAANYSGAIGYWRELTALYPEISYARSAAYWTARSHESLGERERARDAYRELASVDTRDFYARQAGLRLAGVPISTPLDPLVGESLRDPWPVDPRLARARLLSDLGLDGLAQREIDELAAVAEPRAVAALRGLALARSGDRRASLRELRKAFPLLATAHQQSVPRAALELYYPRPFDDRVQHFARAQELPTSLVFGIVHQESGFDPVAQSRSGARGLMQIMPATGRELAQRLKMPYTTQRLFEPDYSLRLGTTYFRQLLGQFDNRVELALAGYNGGPGRIGRLWRAHGATRGAAPTGTAGPEVGVDLFLEDLYLEESRNYVKRILVLAESYRSLYSDLS